MTTFFSPSRDCGIQVDSVVAPVLLAELLLEVRYALDDQHYNTSEATFYSKEVG